MKIAQYIDSDLRKRTNKSFQREIWDQRWSKTSLQDLLYQLDNNPIYWRLTHLLRIDYRILEAGCGFGQWVVKLSNQGYKIEGVDNAKNTINNIKKLEPSLKIKEADVEKLPYNNESFDVYLSFGVIEHFEEGPIKVLKEANRVLKKGGLLYLTVPYLNLFRYLKHIRSDTHNGEFYQYLYSKRDIVKKIENSGFKINEINHYDFINAIIRDFPFVNSVYKKISNESTKIKHVNKNVNKVLKKKFDLKMKEPTFLLQKMLYKLDSYILLIEAIKK